METVLITGVAGFIGSHVAARFLNEGYEVIGVDDLSSGKRSNVPSGINFIHGDLSDMAFVNRLPQDCSLLLHLAGQSSGEISFDNPQADLIKNTISTLNLIEYGIKNNSKKLVYASSMSVYGNVRDEPISEQIQPVPLSCYGVSKLTSERYLNIYKEKLPFVALRMFNVYGPGQDLYNLRQGMVSIYIAQALKYGHISVKGSTDRFRDFVFIDDVVETWWRAATYGISNITLNIGTGRRITVNKLLNEICSNLNGVEFSVIDPTPGDQSGIYANNLKVKEVLSFSEFKPFEEGLAMFLEWSSQTYNKAY